MNRKPASIAVICLLLALTVIPSVGVTSMQSRSSSTGTVAGQANLDGSTLYVGGSGPNNYTKIQDAIENASDGDTIYVYPGEYNGRFSIRKSISLIGKEKNSTVIVGDFMIYSDFSNISNFTIKTDRWAGLYAIEVWGNHTSIYNNNIELYNDSDTGIGVYGSIPKPRAVYTKIIKNSIYNFAKPSRFSTGIEIWYSAYNYVSKNLVVNFSKGIFLLRDSHETLIDNIFIGTGIFIDYYSDYKIKWFGSHIIENNTLNGKPICYINNPSENFSININASEIIIVNASDFKIENMEFQMVLIDSSSNFSIEHNSLEYIAITHCNDAFLSSNTIHKELTCWVKNSTFVGNIFSCEKEKFPCVFPDIGGKHNTIINNDMSYKSVILSGSSNLVEGNEIKGLGIEGDSNIIQHNKISEIGISSSSHNIIRWNEIDGNGEKVGVGLYEGAWFNEVYNNNITNCTTGIYISIDTGGSFHNSITCNNFINNKVDARISGWCYLWDLFLFLFSFPKKLLVERNHFYKNYWQDHQFLTPKVIRGRFTVYISRSIDLFTIPVIQFDWHPSMQPYKWWKNE